MINIQRLGLCDTYYVFHRLLSRTRLESWFANLEQKRHRFVVNSYRHRTDDLLTDASKPNYDKMTEQLII